jgi:hypothetical protein
MITLKQAMELKGMKINKESLYHQFDTIDHELSLLTTIAEADVDWDSIPNSVLEVISSKVKSIGITLDKLYEILYKYPRN